MTWDNNNIPSRQINHYHRGTSDNLQRENMTQDVKKLTDYWSVAHAWLDWGWENVGAGVWVEGRLRNGDFRNVLVRLKDSL